MSLTKLQTAIVSAVVVGALTTPLLVRQHVQIGTLADETAALRQQMSALQTDHERLSNAVASGTPTAATDELLSLRAEVTRLRAEAPAPSHTRGAAPGGDDSLEDTFTLLQSRIATLKQKLEEWPNEKIPELELLTPNDWLKVAVNADLRNDGGVRYNLDQLRMAAKDKLAPIVAEALRNFVDSNNSQLPSSVAQLKPYLSSPISDPVLERYELLHTGSAGDLPSGTPVVGEKSTPNDRMVDSLYSIGLDRYRVKTVTQTINGRGMRRGGGDMEVVKYIPGIQLR